MTTSHDQKEKPSSPDIAATTSSSPPRDSGRASVGRERVTQLKASLRGHDFATQVQMLAPGRSSGQRDARADAVQSAAAGGVAGAGGALPYAAQIQRSFGGYDISNVQAHAGPTADAACDAMGADAYATGNNVALGAGGKDLHTVAHEAAHVVQQRQGVALSGGVGKAGDPYERHADAVADLVVQGKSAEGLLGEMRGGAGGEKAVQRKESGAGGEGGMCDAAEPMSGQDAAAESCGIDSEVDGGGEASQSAGGTISGNGTFRFEPSPADYAAMIDGVINQAIDGLASPGFIGRFLEAERLPNTSAMQQTVRKGLDTLLSGGLRSQLAKLAVAPGKTVDLADIAKGNIGGTSLPGTIVGTFTVLGQAVDDIGARMMVSVANTGMHRSMFVSAKPGPPNIGGSAALGGFLSVVGVLVDRFTNPQENADPWPLDLTYQAIKGMALGALGAKAGAVFGSAAPIVGTIVGMVVGWVGGVVMDLVMAGIRRFIEANRETFGLMLLSTSPAIAWRAAADADKRVETQRQNEAIQAQHIELGQKYLAWTVQEAGQVVT